MEFFKSPFFIDQQEGLYRNSTDDGYNEIDQHRRSIAANLNLREYNPRVILSRYLVNLPVISDFDYDFDKIIEDFEIVEDLIQLSAPKRSTGKNVVQYTYYLAAKELFIYVTTTTSKTAPLFATVYYPVTSNPVELVQWLKDEGYLIPAKEDTSPVIGSLGLNHTGNYSITWNVLNPVTIDFDTMYNEDFKEVSDSIVAHSIIDGKSGLYILHGEPGTGKTSYIKWLAAQSKRSFLYIPQHMVRSLAEPKFIQFLTGHPNYTFIVEDAEEALSHRHAGNSAVSTLLNLTDGILGEALHCQFICTFNTDLSNIDPALLRPGRLLAQYEFGKLTTDKANSYLRSIKSNNVVIEPKTLSEVINMEDMPRVSDQRPKAKFGFI